MDMPIEIWITNNPDFPNQKSVYSGEHNNFEDPNYTSYTLTTHMEAELKRHKEAIRVLRENVQALISEASNSVEYEDWPELQEVIDTAEQALTATAGMGDE